MLGDLGVQQLDAAGQGAQAGHGGGGLKVGVGPLTQPCAGANQAGRGRATQPAAEGVRGSDDQRMQRSLGVGGRLDRGAARRQPHRHRRAMAGRSGLGELLAGQGLAGRPGGVQGVGLGAVAAGSSLGPVPLHNLFLVGSQKSSQASAVTASALDRPDPLAWVAACHLEQLLVAGWGGRHRRLGDHRAGGRGHDRGGVGVLVGVDPDGRARRPLPACASR